MMTKKPEQRSPPSNPQLPSRFDTDIHWAHMIEYMLPSIRERTSVPSKEFIGRNAALSMIGDPAADAVAASIGASANARAARADLEQAIEHGINTVENPSPELQAFFKQADSVPEGLDLARVRNGARLMRRIDPVTFWGVAKAIGFYFGAFVSNTARAARDYAYMSIERVDVDDEARDIVFKSLLGQPMPLFGNAFDNFADDVSLASAQRILGPEVCGRVGTMLKPSLSARLLFGGFNRVRNFVPALDAICNRQTTRFWEETIPMLLERHTGTRNKDFSKGAGNSAVAGTAAARTDSGSRR